MTQSLKLKELERLAFRRTYQDGLHDIYLGGMFASFAALGSTIFPGAETEKLVMLLFCFLGVGASGLIFWLGKRYITLPRIGLVNFGPARKKRRRDLVLALTVIVAVQVLFILLQFFYLQFPALREWLAPIFGRAGSNNLIIAVAAGIFVAPGMLLIAYFADIPHGYYQAVVMVIGVFLMILLDQAWWMVLGGIAILLPGLFQLAQFLRRYPKEMVPYERP